MVVHMDHVRKNNRLNGGKMPTFSFILEGVLEDGRLAGSVAVVVAGNSIAKKTGFLIDSHEGSGFLGERSIGSLADGGDGHCKIGVIKNSRICSNKIKWSKSRKDCCR